VTLEIPALRERPDDIAVLAEHFLRQAGFEGQLSDILPDSALEDFKKHAWPGNVRELRNVVHGALALGEAPQLERDGLRRDPHSEGSPGLTNVPSSMAEELSVHPYGEARRRLLESFEIEYVRAILDRAGGNVSLAARRSEMDRSHLTRLIKKLGVRPGRGGGET